MSCPIFEVLYHGNRGGGKTLCLIMDYGQHVGMGNGSAWRGILFRQTYKQLGDVIAKTREWFPKIFGKKAKYNTTNSSWEWDTGERLLLRHFMRESDYDDYHGHEYPWIGWEELTKWKTDAGYRKMMSTCRSANKDLPRKIRATTNPYGPLHNFVKMRFRLEGTYKIGAGPVIKDSYDIDGNLEEPRVAIKSSLEENKILLDADPNYLQRVLAAARNDAERKAWKTGDWDIVAGGMFDDVWKPQQHILEPFDIPDTWRIDRSLDWGSSKPYSYGLWAQSDGSDVLLKNGKYRSTIPGDIFRIAEIYGWNGEPNKGCRKLATEVGRDIAELETNRFGPGRVLPGPADNAIFDVNEGRAISRDLGRPVRLKSGRIVPGPIFIRSDKSPGSRKTGLGADTKNVGGRQKRRGGQGVPWAFCF